MGIIRGDFAKNLTTDVFTTRAENFQKLQLPRLNFDGQPLEEESLLPRDPTSQPAEPSHSVEPTPMAPMAPPPVVEIPDETLAIFYDRAFQKGLDEGRMQAGSEVSELKRRYAEALQSLINVSQQLENSNRLQLIQLACQIAEQIIRQQVVIRPESLLELIDKAIDEMKVRDEVTIVCNMEDYEYLVGHIDQLKQHPNHTFRINLMVDDMLDRGDFRIQTFQGSTEWKIAPQVEGARNALLQDGD